MQQRVKVRSLMLIGRECVHVTKEIDDPSDCTANFGKEIQFFANALKILATHEILHRGIQLRFFLLPIPDVGDNRDRVVNLGILEHDRKYAITDVSTFGNFGHLEHTIFRLQVLFGENYDDALALADALHEVTNGIFVPDLIFVSDKNDIAALECLLEFVDRRAAIIRPRLRYKYLFDRRGLRRLGCPHFKVGLSRNRFGQGHGRRQHLSDQRRCINELPANTALDFVTLCGEIL
jgi:hypothetical protein